MRPLVRGLILCVLMTGIFQRPAFAKDGIQTEIKNLISSLDKNKKSVGDNKVEKVATPDVKVRFLWASWCEYCERSYSSLTTLLEDPELKGKVAVEGYCLDDEYGKPAQEKTKAMNKITQFYVDRKNMVLPVFAQRLPVFLVESSKNSQYDVYTGFSNERFHYLAKTIRHSVLKNGDAGE